jgi:sugar O-acyltransferase (sialic acid O-acetyltransferase NeuD family)
LKKILLLGKESLFTEEVLELVADCGYTAFTFHDTQELINVMDHEELSRAQFAVIPNTASIRRSIYLEAQPIIAPCEPILHPTASMSSSVIIGLGSMVHRLVSLGSRVRIGGNTVINRSASVGHHSTIGDHVHIGPGVTICGHVVIEDSAFIGAGSVLIPNVRIHAGATVGAGTVVIRDVGPKQTVVGNPARQI